MKKENLVTKCATPYVERELVDSVALEAIQATKLIRSVERGFSESSGDYRWLKQWLATFENDNTIDIADKEITRLFFWMRYHIVKIDNFDSDCARRYLNNLREPKPRGLWIGPRCRKTLPDGGLNPLWRPLAGPLSAPSIRLSYSMCRSFFNFLVSQGVVSRNPFAGVRAGQIKSSTSAQRPRSSLSKKARSLIERALISDDTLSQKKSVRLLWIYSFLVVTGLRRSECVRARISDLKIDESGDLWLQVIGKGNVLGEVPFPAFLEPLFNTYLSSCLDNAASLRSLLLQRSDMPLVGAYLHPGHAISEEALWHCVKLISKRALSYGAKAGEEGSVLAEVGAFSTHWLRHTSASVQLNDLGLNVAQVRDNLRHASIATTSKYISTDHVSRHALLSSWKLEGN